MTVIEKEVNAMGEPCPIPVVKTKKAIQELGTEGGLVKTRVDNEIAVQNLEKMAKQKGYGVSSEKLGADEYLVTMTVGTSPSGAADEGNAVGSDHEMECAVCAPDKKRKNRVVVISSAAMGTGDDTLGAALMKGFIFALSQQDELPSTILFYNGGARLTCEDAPTLEDLRAMEEQGVEILTCGTCLNHYGLTEALRVGGITNMYTIVEKQVQADLIIRP